jgi:hypothetical protein
MATGRAGGLGTTAIEGCIALVDLPMAGGGRTIATNARAELAALVEAAGYGAGLVAALIDAEYILSCLLWAGEFAAPPTPERCYSVTIGQDQHKSALRALRGARDALAGRGAAGARDETRTWEDGYAEGHEEGWRTGLKAAGRLRQALVDLLGSADCSWEEQGGGHDWPEACEEARAAWAEFDALRAGGAGEETEG